MAKKIRSILIYGYGVMGRGVAGTFAAHGFETMVRSSRAAALQDLPAGVRAVDRLPAQPPDLVLELVPEDVATKQRVYAEVEAAWPDGEVILATGTSGLDLVELARPRSVIGPQVEQVLDLVGLSDKGARYPKQLSGGEQQRVSVARAFVNRPPIMLCDEPTGNLDPKTSVGIMKLLDRINRTGTTIVMATHDFAIVDAMQRRVVALEKGLVTRDEHSGRYEQGEG